MAPAPNAGFVARRIGSLGDQLDATRGELDLLRIQLDRANAILDNSMKYQIPADLAASIYDIALSEGIDPALGFQLVKIESSFKANARSSMGAIGYTQLQVTTARFYEPDVTERALTQRELPGQAARREDGSEAGARLGAIIGSTPAMVEVYKTVARVAPTHDRCGAASKPAAAIARTVFSVFSRVEPPAP